MAQIEEEHKIIYLEIKYTSEIQKMYLLIQMEQYLNFKKLLKNFQMFLLKNKRL
ncbi:unnamed protein product [Paramecium sonneborni]|uniref:Uncharacterized protein n=1 Tax=Paramecium sonneborni TaxID=65129 RepID=A0A8S1QH21_9CILI|nr:unnamed protein product [Paramecium sonneborni]